MPLPEHLQQIGALKLAARKVQGFGRVAQWVVPQTRQIILTFEAQGREHVADISGSLDEQLERCGLDILSEPTDG